MRRQVAPDELERLYLGLGKGIWHLQYVEDALNMLITIKHEVKEPGRISAADSRAALEKHRRNTLGTSLRVVREQGLVSTELLTRLAVFKGERDWLVHRSQNTHGERLYTGTGRDETFGRIETFVESASTLQKEIVAQIDAYARSQGIDTVAVEQAAHAKIAELKGEA